MSTVTPERRRNRQQRRPATITELAERALDNLYEEKKPLKHYLKLAERYRKDAKDYNSRGDLENAFIYFARAATLALDKLPTHREFYALLNPTQRSNLNLNGAEILEALGEVKCQLVKRYEEWMRECPDGDGPIPSASTATTNTPQNDSDSSLRDTRSRGNEWDRGQHRRVQEDYLRRQDIENVAELTAQARERIIEWDTYQDGAIFVIPPSPPPVAAALVSQTTPALDYTFSHSPLRSQNGQVRPDRTEQSRRSLRDTRNKGKERDRGQRRIQDPYFQGQDDTDDVDELTARARERNIEMVTYQDGAIFVIPPSPPPVATAAQAAALVSQTTPAPDYTYPLLTGQTDVVRTAPRPDWTEPSRRYMERKRQYQYQDEQQQKEMRRREEDILRIREIRRREEEGILRRQKEAEDAARAARSIYPPLPVVSVVYTDSRNPTSRLPSHIAMSNPEPVIPLQVLPQPQKITPPQATQQVPEQVPYPQLSPLTVLLTSLPSSPTHPSSSRLSAIQTLLTRLSKLKAVGASTVNDDTISLLCGLLDLHDATIVSEVATASGGELLVDFLVNLLREGSLASSRVIQNASRKARKLMFKLISKIDVIPRSLFITDVSKDPQAIVAGGFGNVFKGKHDGQLVALKMLYKGHRAGDSIEKNLHIEALTWQSLSHRFILPFLGIYEEGSQLFLVSPFMTNGALRDWRKEHTPVRIDEIQRLLLEVAEGVQYIHSDGIVHGDLHGGNVLIDSEFHCQITDFGSTRHSEATVTRSTTALAVNFAAPELFGSCAKCGELECNGCYEDQDEEQHRGKTIETDVYAFGCLYYAIFFNTVPFRENSYLQVIRHVANGVRPKRLHDPRMADHTWNLVQKCWKSNPSERPTMEEIVTMLVGPSV